VQETNSRQKQFFTAVSKATGLIRRLMQFGRAEDMHYVPVQLNNIISEALQLIQPLVRENVKLKAELCGSLPTIVADPSQLEQALVNLFMNALDAMPTGGELSITTAVGPNPKSPKKLPQNSVSIVVADTGTGIPQAVQSAIFDPFFTTKLPGKGTGLGLSSVYGVVRQHNGTIDVESAPGAGASFVISLPTQLDRSEPKTAG
jgi:two-component system cell cycle sensor histidine kinase/response regulator CckA